MDKRAETGREFWRGCPARGRCDRDPAVDARPGAGRRRARTRPSMTTSRQRCAGWPTGWSCRCTRWLLAAHAKVLAALSGEQDVVTGYAAGPGGRPLPCPLTTEARSWRSLLRDTARVESDLLTHRDFPVDELERELGVAGPAFETEFDPIGSLVPSADQHRPRRGRRAPGGAPSPAAGSRCACGTGTDALDADSAEQDRRLPPHRPRADGRRPGRRARAGEPAVGRGAALPARRAGRAAPGAAGPPVPRAVRAAGAACTRTPSRPCTATGSGPTGSSTRAPTGWRARCWRAGCAARAWSRW